MIMLENNIVPKIPAVVRQRWQWAPLALKGSPGREAGRWGS